MHLALIIDDYLPNSTRIGAKMFHELAVELKNKGHAVTVITPDENQTASVVIDDLDGIRIWRFKSGAIKDTNKIFRAINESFLSYRAWSSIKKLIKSDSFDGVVYYSPSIFWGGIVKKIKKRCQCRSYLVLRDLFPQWVIDAGMIKPGSIIEKYFRHFESTSYEQADLIGLMSERNVECFQQANGNHKFDVELLRNWTSVTNVNISRTGAESYRQRLGLAGKLIYFYGGNIGHAQDMANLMRLAKNMSTLPDAHFLFVGQGDEVELINNLAEEWKLKNFTYLPSVNQNEFKQILSEVDVGLFSLSKLHTTHNFPGKILGYMNEALPILGSVNSNNDLMPMINNNEAGYIHINGEDDALLSSAVNLYNNIELRTELGNNSRKLIDKEFSVEMASIKIVSSLRSDI
ncbi:glycosyltransferase family 4 protein [Vibrio coralliilyticus]|uniref:glycosyltransferase family 4 protein n=1 Tax=Vibrio coralliilyticus TaxID=190893 RepID=UPI0002F57036|nr:glycosyltransferase family 4 protein [Vibrio coralliilyticus]